MAKHNVNPMHTLQCCGIAVACAGALACTTAPSVQGVGLPLVAAAGSVETGNARGNTALATGDQITLLSPLTVEPGTARAWFSDAPRVSEQPNCYMEVNRLAGATSYTVDPGSFSVWSVGTRSEPGDYFPVLPASNGGGDNDASFVVAWYSVRLAKNESGVRAFHCVGEYSFAETARYANADDLRAAAGDILEFQ